jgi:hypothetical protein
MIAIFRSREVLPTRTLNQRPLPYEGTDGIIDEDVIESLEKRDWLCFHEY